MTPTCTERKNHPGTYKIVVDLDTLAALRRRLARDPAKASSDLYVAIVFAADAADL